jgi:hypothetical protein
VPPRRGSPDAAKTRSSSVAVVHGWLVPGRAGAVFSLVPNNGCPRGLRMSFGAICNRTRLVPVMLLGIVETAAHLQTNIFEMGSYYLSLLKNNLL